MTLNKNVKQTINEIKEESPPPVVDVNEQTQTPVDINDVLKAVQHLGENRDYVIKTILAVFMSTFLEKKDPVWIMLVGNPSSNKTTLVDLLSPLADVYKLDTMTSNPFSSGQKEKEKPQDLLPLLDNKCFIIKEYGTLFGRSDEMVKQLISDFVAIYDGEYAKHSPTRGTKRYKSHFSHIGCITPMALSSRQKYMSAVGARFLFLRIQALTEEERSYNLDKIWNSQNAMAKEEVSQIVCSLALHLKEKILRGYEVKFLPAVQKQLNSLANLTACARGIVITDQVTFNTSEGNQTHYEVSDIQVEEPFRALKQLKKLAKCLAIVNSKHEVGVEEIQIVKQVVLSSMPIRRADVLKAFEQKSLLTAPQAVELIGKNYRTVKRNFDELVALKVLKSEKGVNDHARTYTLRNEFLDIFSPPQMGEQEVKTLFDN